MIAMAMRHQNIAQPRAGDRFQHRRDMGGLRRTRIDNGDVRLANDVDAGSRMGEGTGIGRKEPANPGRHLFDHRPNGARGERPAHRKHLFMISKS